MLLVIDDAQWLDDESARVLTFVARRLHADPIAMLFALRDTGAEHLDRFTPLPGLEIVGLPEDDARTLLTSVAGARSTPTSSIASSRRRRGTLSR